jgi:transposase InsO family protein
MNGFKVGRTLPGAARLYYTAAKSDLSKKASQRLGWLDWYRAHGSNARLTCRHFGISADTFYRWKRRYKGRQLSRLEDQSRRPNRLRQPQTTPPQEARIRAWREKYPRWGKDKIRVLLKTYDGIDLSASTIGRVLGRLKEKGLLREPAKLKAVRNRHRVQRPWARRKPKEYIPQAPGDIVQVDTLDIEILPGVRRKQFTARDMISKYDALRAYSQATSYCGRLFLDHLARSMPFDVRAIQIDGGSEFMGEFESECQNRGIKLFVLPPRSPKLNGGVERANRTHTEEFYDVHDIPTAVDEHNIRLETWENTYNRIRPHQSLGYLTPAQFVEKWFELHPKEA